DNTDVAGFDAAVRDLVGEYAGARVLLLGAGGAARAALLALVTGGAAEIVLRNRTADRATSLQLEIDPERRRTRVAASAGELDGQRFDLVVNATSLGLHSGDALPLRLDA